MAGENQTTLMITPIENKFSNPIKRQMLSGWLVFKKFQIYTLYKKYNLDSKIQIC